MAGGGRAPRPTLPDARRSGARCLAACLTAIAGEGSVGMGSWFWVNFPLALLFFCAWTGIPLWLVLTRWRREIEEKHAEIAALVAVQAVADLDELVSSVSDEAVAEPYEVTAS